MARRKGLYSSQIIPAPKELQKSASSPETLGLAYAVKLEEFIPPPGKGNSLGIRHGLQSTGDAIGAGVITEIMEYRKSDGTLQILAYTNDGKIHSLNEGTGAWTEQKTGLDTDGTIFWTEFNSELVIVNGIDTPFAWNGSTMTDLSEYVEERRIASWADQNQFTVKSSTDISGKYPTSGNIIVTFSASNLAVTSITLSGSTATVTTTAAHNLTTGDLVTISNAAEEEYNGTFEITVSSTTVFTYTVSGSPSSPATVNTQRIKAVRGSKKPVGGWVTTDTTFNYATGIGSTASNSTGVQVSVISQDANFFLTLELQYRKSGEATWRVGDRKKLRSWKPQSSSEYADTFEVKGLPADTYEWRFMIAEGTDLAEDRNPTGNNSGISHAETIYVQPGFASRKAVGAELIDGIISDDGLVLEAATLTHSSGTATFTSTSNHMLNTGDVITVYDASDDLYNVTAEILSTPTSTTFTFKISGNPTSPASASSSLPTTIVYSVDKIEVTDTVSTSSYSSGNQLLTVTTSSNILPDVTGVTIDKLEYEDSPPAFSFIFAKHDRLWALAPKELTATTFGAAEGDRMKVYYTDSTNNKNTWYNRTTQSVGYINLAQKQSFHDELVGISDIEGNMTFHGRRQLQVWAGTDPTATGDFTFIKKIPVGTVHGKLIQNFPGDVFFFTPYGARSLRNVFQSAEIELVPDLGSNVDPDIQAAVTTLLSSDANYKKARSWFYERDGFYGFYLGSNPFVYSLQEESKGFVRFKGDFANSTAFFGLSDGRLMTGVNDQLKVYANGADGNDIKYLDGTTAIRAIWESPWIEKNFRWGNRSWNFITETQSYATMLFRRYKDSNKSMSKDYLITIDTRYAKWDDDVNSQWDDGLAWDSTTARPTIVNDQFIAQNFAFRMEVESLDKPFIINGLIALGGR